MKRLTNVLVFVVSSLLCLPFFAHAEALQTEAAIRQAYLDKVDGEYAFNLAKSLEEFKSNPKLGYRTAGSQAEKQAARMLYDEMQRIGLADVTMDEFTVDGWEFNRAELKFTDAKGQQQLAVLGGYQTDLDTKGAKKVQVVFGGRGTAADLEGLDVKGKFVLIDINQRSDWWINYPAYQAHVLGAAGVLAAQDGGYGEISPTSLNAQDICGPAFAPALSISRAHADLLKEALTKAGGELTVSLDVKSVVLPDTKAYNVHGSIPGKDKDALVLVSAHYDAYFTGFQDDTIAISTMLAIAKGLVDSGFKPEKTIVFNALAAEEWGVSNSRYDWSTGAYNQIFRVRPEWVGKAVVDMNFEMTAYQHEPVDKVRAVQELVPFLERFITTVPASKDAYPGGVQVVSPVRTWSDDFSFAIAGVPSLRNDFEEGDFRTHYYHSDFDTDKTFDRGALEHHLTLYGLMTVAYDRTAVTPLDFAVRLKEIKASVQEKGFKQAGGDRAELLKKLDASIKDANALYKKVDALNAAYAKALEAGDSERAASIYAASRELNSKLLQAFKHNQDSFVRLTWEDEPILAHEHAVTNYALLNEALNALKKGDIATALDEYLWKVDNNWYAYNFDKQVYDYFTDYVLRQPADRLNWGAGRIVGYENLFDLVQSLKAKQATGQKVDLSEEMALIKSAMERQKSILTKVTAEEVQAVAELQTLLQEALKLVPAI